MNEILNIVTMSGTIILVIIICVIVNKEINTSKEKMEASDRMLEAERKKLEGRIHVQSVELRRSRALRMSELSKVAEFGRLSQGIFHDLMSPLTSLTLHTEKLKTLSPENIEGLEKTLNKAVAASKSLGSYMESIRTTIQMDSIEKVCDIQGELSQIIDLFAFKIRESNVTISISKSDGHEVIWFGNAIKIRQILSNLISNAIDSFDKIEDGRNRNICISISRKEKNIILSIQDNGIGISKDVLEKIFIPFYTTKTPDKGTGIGLSTVEYIVENDLKGNIEVTSEVNQGSNFIITFPLNLE